jgi:hypothetical protein
MPNAITATLSSTTITPVEVAEPVATPVLPLADSVDSYTDLPQLRLERLHSVQIPITSPGIMSLVGQKVTDQTIQMAMTYVNQAFSEYCATNNVQPANILGHAQHVNQHIVEHVCHDQTSDGFHVDNQTRRYDIGRNGWVTDYSFDHTTGALNVSLNLADISYEANPNYVANLREHWVPPNPINVEGYDIRCTNGIMELVDGETWFENASVPDKRMRYRKNLRIQVKSRVDYSFLKGYTESERKAIDTLREMISESDFRKYLKYGFVTVSGASGRAYQVFRSRSHTKVWDSGVVVEEVCVRIQDWSVPPTDNVIAFMTMIQADEESFKKLGNVYKMVKQAA